MAKMFPPGNKKGVVKPLKMLFLPFNPNLQKLIGVIVKKLKLT
jgi:hypothetical protein